VCEGIISFEAEGTTVLATTGLLPAGTGQNHAELTLEEKNKVEPPCQAAEKACES